MSSEPTIDSTTLGAIRFSAGDPRYLAVVDKQFNKRFRARPDYVRVVHSTAQATSAVQDAMNDGRRVVVTSGGHCLEGFVSDPDVRVVVRSATDASALGATIQRKARERSPEVSVSVTTMNALLAQHVATPKF